MTLNTNLKIRASYFGPQESEYCNAGTSLVVHWLRHSAPNAGGPGLIPGQGTRSHKLQLNIPCATTKTQHS